MANFRFFTGLSQEESDSEPERNENNTSRFMTYTAEQLKGMTVKKLSKNTVASTKVGVSLLSKFCVETGINFDIETSSKEKLNCCS